MANFEYKNIDEILGTTLPIRGARVTLEDNKLLEKIQVTPLVDPPPDPTDNFEFHTFLPNSAYISTIYNLKTWKLEGDQLSLDVHRDMRNSRSLPGVYKVVYNFFKNVVGGFDSPVRLFISDISTDRTELKLSLVNPDSDQGKEQLKTFILNYLFPSTTLPSFVLNFGENKIQNIINATSDGSAVSFYVKLYEPLAADLDIFFECWVAEELMRPYIETVNYIAEEVDIQLNQLKGANFEVDIDYWLTTETDFKSWNDILSSNVQTSQEILDRYISSSNSPVTLNVNFREFENFVFYSSAEDRINNFMYKMELVERYNNELQLFENVYTGSFESNKVKIKSLRDKTISGFDSFEKWLYYETTGSNYYTSQASSSITPYPKYEVSVTSSDYNIATKEGKYKIYTSGSNAVETWYNSLIDLATDYDLKNYNALNKAIPEHIRDGGDSEQFTTFVNMVGHHFDVIYLYTDHLTKKNLREEHPKDGMSQDLIYDVTKNLGWTLSHGTQAKDLWEYALGVSGSGEPVWTGKTTTNKYLSKSQEERTKEVWRRILNNLPYIYKSKGTARGIKALLGAYGIPQTLLTIREYGGPDNADLGVTPRAEWEKHTYYLNFTGNLPLPTKQHYIRLPWEQINNSKDEWQYPDTLTFRWKMEPSTKYNYSGYSKQTLLQKQSGSRVDWFVVVNKNGTDDDKGSLYFYIGNGTTYATASIVDEYLYDDVPLNLMIRRSVTNDDTGSNQIYDFHLKTQKYGKVVIERSASIVVSGSLSGSYNGAWSSNGQLFIGSGSNNETSNILTGSVYEIRYWANSLDENSFRNHTLAPRAYNGNTETSSFYDLQAQWKFWQKFDVATTSSLSSSHPDQNKRTFYSSSKMAYFHNFDSGGFESIVETYNMEVPTLASNTIYTEKVRIDSGSLVGSLSKDKRSEVSAFDTFSVDSDKLMVAFSPQHVINEDIIESIGGVTIDDYIGAYSNIKESEYRDLKWLSRQYWQKYKNRNDFNAYINLISVFDFSVFDQIRQTLPARSNPILGLVIEPNILERSKIDGTGRELAGSTNYSVDTNEISSSGTITQVYSKNEATFRIIGDQDGEVQDIFDDIDIVPLIPTVVQDKKATITNSLPEPNIDLHDKKAILSGLEPSTELDIKDKKTIISGLDPSTELNVSDKKATIPGLKAETELTLSEKNGSVQISPDTDIELSEKNTTITELVPTTELTISEKKGTVEISPDPSVEIFDKKTKIEDLIPDTFFSMSEKVGTLSDLTPDTNLTISEKQTIVDDLIPDTNLTISEKVGTLSDLIPNTNLTVSEKQTAITDLSPNTNLDISQTKTTISELEPITDFTYSDKNTTISDLDIIPNLTYSDKSANITDLSSKTIVEYSTKDSLIDVGSEILNSSYNELNSIISETVSKNLETNYISVNTSVGNTSNTLLKSIVGAYNTLQQFGNFAVNVVSTYGRNNIIYSSSAPNIGYGLNWTTQNNLSSKALSFIQTIDSYRTDNFYKKYYLYYSSSMKYDSKDPYSSSLGPSTVQNQHNLATSLRRQRFEGSKLIGPDVNVGSDGTLDGTPVVEVYVVGSTEIIYRSYENGGNLTTGI